MLVIDDCEINIQMLTIILDDSKIDSDCVFSGPEALEMIEQRIVNVENGKGEMYKAILLDFSMPEMDGPTTSRRLREMLEQ